MRLVLGICKMSRSPHPHTRILKVSIEALTGFSQVHSPDGRNNTLFSQGVALENCSHSGNGTQNRHFKNRGGVGESTVA